MLPNELKKRAAELDIDPKSKYEPFQRLITEGFLDTPVSSEELATRIREKSGRRIPTSYVQTYMRRFMKEGIVHAITMNNPRRNFWVLASVEKREALLLIGKSQKVRELEEQMLSPVLSGKLQKDFATELGELHDNFGKNGNCTAFLLRKILEKLLIITFGKLNKGTLLEDKNLPGGFKGLEQMIEIAAREKVNGMPILMGKTANAIKGIKFLGDTAAHNPLVSVDVSTILPQLPFIITAYKELASHL